MNKRPKRPPKSGRPPTRSKNFKPDRRNSEPSDLFDDLTDSTSTKINLTVEQLDSDIKKSMDGINLINNQQRDLVAEKLEEEKSSSAMNKPKPVQIPGLKGLGGSALFRKLQAQLNNDSDSDSENGAVKKPAAVLNIPMPRTPGNSINSTQDEKLLILLNPGLAHESGPKSTEKSSWCCCGKGENKPRPPPLPKKPKNPPSSRPISQQPSPRSSINSLLTASEDDKPVDTEQTKETNVISGIHDDSTETKPDLVTNRAKAQSTKDSTENLARISIPKISSSMHPKIRPPLPKKVVVEEPTTPIIPQKEPHKNEPVDMLQVAESLREINLDPEKGDPPVVKKQPRQSDQIGSVRSSSEPTTTLTSVFSSNVPSNTASNNASMYVNSGSRADPETLTNGECKNEEPRSLRVKPDLQTKLEQPTPGYPQKTPTNSAITETPEYAGSVISEMPMLCRSGSARKLATQTQNRSKIAQWNDPYGTQHNNFKSNKSIDSTETFTSQNANFDSKEDDRSVSGVLSQMSKGEDEDYPSSVSSNQSSIKLASGRTLMTSVSEQNEINQVLTAATNAGLTEAGKVLPVDLDEISSSEMSEEEEVESVKRAKNEKSEDEINSIESEEEIVSVPQNETPNDEQTKLEAMPTLSKEASTKIKEEIENAPAVKPSFGRRGVSLKIRNSQPVVNELQNNLKNIKLRNVNHNKPRPVTMRPNNNLLPTSANEFANLKLRKTGLRKSDGDQETDKKKDKD